MTNKKFKVAAMSMALTACVAAQPLIANAVEPDDVSEPASTANESAAPAEESAAVAENDAPVEEPVAVPESEVPAEEPAAVPESTAPSEEPTVEPESQPVSEPESTASTPDNTNEGTLEKSSQETKKTEEAFGDNVDVKYDPATKDEKPDGTTTIDGTVVKNDGADGTEDGKTDDKGTSDGDTDEKKDEFGGTATKTETPDGKPEVAEPVAKPGAEPRPDPDPDKKPTTDIGSDGTITITTPTITDGTQTTTTTGSGHAEADTAEKTSESTEIDLEEELGENADIKWDDAEKADKGTPIGDKGYTIDSVKTDGNKQTLTLVKEDPLKEGHMTSEDVAKLVDLADAEKTDNGDGSYTLKRTEEITDKDGKTITRTTYITVNEKDSYVSIKSSTTLVVSREKKNNTDSGSVDVSKDLKFDITLKDTSDENIEDTISSDKLNELIGKANIVSKSEDGTEITYKVTDGNKEYTITKNTKSDILHGDELKQRLQEKLGKNFTADGDDVYYVDADGKQWLLTIEQSENIREILSYTVDVTVKGAEKGDTITEGKEAAEVEAKTDAIKNALTNALVKMGLTEEDARAAVEKKADTIKLTGGLFDVTVNGKSYTLTYTGASVTPGTSTSKNDEEGKIDVRENEVIGSSYVTSGSVEWTDGKTESGSRSDFTGKDFTLPTDAKLTNTEVLGENKVKKTYTIVSEDGKITTTYEVIEETLTLTDAEKEDFAWSKLESELKKTREELKNAGYSISKVTFDGSVKKVDWTITQTVKDAKKDSEEDLNKVISASGKNSWTIDEAAGTITIKGQTPFENVKKNEDGSYTCTVEEDGKKVTYTFTEKKNGELSDADIKKMLADEFQINADDITLSTDGKTASYKDGDKTITIDYSSLKKDLIITKEVHSSNSTTVTIKNDENYNTNFKKACEKLLDEIKEKVLPTLKEGEELWIGNTQVTKDTTLTDTIMEYFTKAISPDDMTEDEIIKALQEQERIAKETYVKVNENTKYEETLKNYYSGDTDTEHKYGKNNSSGNGNYGPGPGGPNHGGQNSNTKGDYIGHLELASDSKLDLLPDEKGNVETTDCVLIRDGLTLKWNYDAEDLIKNDNGEKVGLKNEISYDKPGKHYEYARINDWDNNNPDKSAFYKVTGTVVYDAVKENGEVKKFNNDWWGYERAKEAYLKETGLSAKDVTAADYAKYIVLVGDKYQVYTKSSQLEAYGYMSRDANTCANGTGYRQTGSYEYIGGFDLKISKLVQVRDGKIIGQTESSVKTIVAPWSIRSNQEHSGDFMTLGKKTTYSPSKTELDSGSNSTASGNYSYSYTQDHKETLGSTVEGKGNGFYNSFVSLVDRVLHGESGQQTKDDGSFTYRYDYTTVGDLNVDSVTRTVKKHAEVDYRYTIEDVRDVEIPGKDIVHITPDPEPGPGPGPNIIDENTPDSPILPGSPELPPVQDARPDAPVLPSDPVLPPVQDARIDAALPQTGVNWLTAIGLALSGMTLMVTGAFTSLTGKKAKH